LARWRTVPYVGSYTPLDVHYLARHKALRAGGAFCGEYSNGKSASLFVANDHITVIIEGREESIRLAHTVPGYGGKRSWFRCPMCNRRRAKLYFVGRLACRECARLRYGSKSEGRRDRLARKARKIRARVGCSDSLAVPFPPKPSGMWWRTYELLRAQEAAIERERIAMFLPVLARLHQQVARRPLLRQPR